MAISFDAEHKVFNLSTPNTTYLFGLFKNKFLLHIYYGKKVTGSFDIKDVCDYGVRGFSAESSKW